MSRDAAAATPAAPRSWRSPSGLWWEINANGSLRRMGRADDLLNLFVGNEVEGGPANLWLRLHQDGGVELLPLLGPASPSRPQLGGADFGVTGEARGLHWQLTLRLAHDAAAWFWHLRVENRSAAVLAFDLVLVQDIALTAYGAVRLNEHYVSHYVDLAPLHHARHGCVLAARQNLAVGGGRHPWALVGSLRHGASFATDALQVLGLAARSGSTAAGLLNGLPRTRLQHEHALVAIQDATLTLPPGETAATGFFGRIEADHPAASGDADLALVDATLVLPEAAAPPFAAGDPGAAAPAATLFGAAPWLDTLDLTDDEIDAHFGRPRRHEERAGATLLSFFTGDATHVVLRAKELEVLRPHGHIVRSGGHLTPDETALTSTLWMGGVFHSMVTQGHVSVNRFLSTVHGYLGQFRSHGQRIFVQVDGAWQQLGLPSAFEMRPDACRWIYRHRGGTLVVHGRALHSPPALELSVEVLGGAPLRLLVTHHVALGGDDGSGAGAACWRADGDAVRVTPPAGSELAQRFPTGAFVIAPAPGSRFVRCGGDEVLFADGLPHGQPFVCIEALAAPSFALRLVGQLVSGDPVPAAAPLPALRLRAVPGSPHADDVARLADILPWYGHNALVHYLAPRGLEQYSGGGWGTRDVCQGPLEMLLACGRTAPVRDLLLRTFAAQNDDGDWPQWFSFFERDRHVRAGDSHGDIVFWPLLGLARYLIAAGDAALLDERLPFHGGAEALPLWQHVQRALALIAARRIAGTHLAAYGHGDWNDALQPADPALRGRLCSAWTVTLHHQMLETLAAALRGVGRDADALPLAVEAMQVRADFQRLLVRDGVVAGYALFAAQCDAEPALLLHPGDALTGLRYSLLPMMHAVLEDMLAPAQARAQMALIKQHLSGPDGARLFDAPMAYRGGPERLFQRAESCAYFGREIGVMYMHAHLRYAEALAHLGDAEGFFAALCRAHPIGLQHWVPSAAARQVNCYYSSSDAAFADRYEAQRDYARVQAGTVALEGGWRIYSSGPGLALALVMRHFVGIGRERQVLVLDPVLPAALDGLQVATEVDGKPLHLRYRVGAAGCGVRALTLNGHALPFERRANPYRSGAAVVARAAFEAARGPGPDTLQVEID